MKLYLNLVLFLMIIVEDFSVCAVIAEYVPVLWAAEIEGAAVYPGKV